jgi:ArsR family transcriptional regulator
MLRSVQLFRALADETRLRILNLLVRGEACVCEIEHALEIGQSKASRHLAYLRNAGLVTDRREGPWMYYAVADPDGLAHRFVLEWLAQANGEIPQAAADLKALEELRTGGEVCGKCTVDSRERPGSATAATRCQP